MGNLRDRSLGTCQTSECFDRSTFGCSFYAMRPWLAEAWHMPCPHTKNRCSHAQRACPRSMDSTACWLFRVSLLHNWYSLLAGQLHTREAMMDKKKPHKLHTGRWPIRPGLAVFPDHLPDAGPQLPHIQGIHVHMGGLSVPLQHGLKSILRVTETPKQRSNIASSQPN